MSTYRVVSHALGVCVVCACASLALSGCSLVRHRAGTGCREAPFNANTANRPPLVVPPGLSAPDTKSGIKIPELNAPERLRGKTEPCLAEPPSYGNEPPRPRSVLPLAPSAPTPTPAPAPGSGADAGSGAH